MKHSARPGSMQVRAHGPATTVAYNAICASKSVRRLRELPFADADLAAIVTPCYHSNRRRTMRLAHSCGHCEQVHGADLDLDASRDSAERRALHRQARCSRQNQGVQRA